ncbi:LysR family transcriptional regulator [Propionivibrio soli]|uniref:LysR family transcriptional regulator n=1 Tax=Propionivibrio soli TaxID=2976531 RepID=UPI0021E8AE6C|nr:LysR substrate-binding domain-containing protein [Propionivibrio soli]
MDLRDLRYFETIAELEHVGRAAEILHRTQPALTGCLRRLEEACGAPLFEKSGRGIRLTAAGKVLLKWARSLRSQVDDAEREIRELGNGITGHIRIGIVPTAAQFLLPSAVRKMLDEAPKVTLRTVVGLSDSLKEQLLQGDLDLMVGTEGAAEVGLVSEVLAEDMIVVAAVADHEIFHTEPILNSLPRYRWALQPVGAPTRDWLDRTFDQLHLPRPKVQVETTMLLMLPMLIAETGLLSFISRLHLESNSSASRLREVPVSQVSMRRRLVVTYRENSYLPPAARRLIELLPHSI